jgi:hypothetical protein
MTNLNPVDRNLEFESLWLFLLLGSLDFSFAAYALRLYQLWCIIYGELKPESPWRYLTGPMKSSLVFGNLRKSLTPMYGHP